MEHCWFVRKRKRSRSIPLLVLLPKAQFFSKAKKDLQRGLNWKRLGEKINRIFKQWCPVDLTSLAYLAGRPAKSRAPPAQVRGTPRQVEEGNDGWIEYRNCLLIPNNNRSPFFGPLLCTFRIVQKIKRPDAINAYPEGRIIQVIPFCKFFFAFWNRIGLSLSFNASKICLAAIIGIVFTRKI